MAETGSMKYQLTYVVLLALAAVLLTVPLPYVGERAIDGEAIRVFLSGKLLDADPWLAIRHGRFFLALACLLMLAKVVAWERVANSGSAPAWAPTGELHIFGKFNWWALIFATVLAVAA